MLTQEGPLGQRSTYHELILIFLRYPPGVNGLTATELYQQMCRCGWPAKLNSLSGVIARMVKKGSLSILPDQQGPRGGHVYVSNV